jgi:hypothetical protein
MNKPSHCRRRAALLSLAALLPIATTSAFAGAHYVDVNSTNATPPYTSWATAATNIQDAVEAAVAGDEVVVTNGVYSPVGLSKSLNVRSINGARLTVIDGGGKSGCAYLTNGASLSGFTLTNGSVVDVDFGSGAVGGGASGGTLNNCTLANNEVYADYAYGGGAYYCTLNNCVLTGNRAISSGAFPDSAFGGGASYCTLNNCTVTGNSVYTLYYHQYRFGGGADSCTLNNCIVYSNKWSGSEDDLSWSSSSGFVNNCWVWPSNPLFVDYVGGNLRLQSNSPCVNAGNKAFAPAGPDLDGNPRIVGGTVDIGAYEYQSPLSQISYAWLQQYGLPINAATDTADPDGDAVDNYHEWLAGTDPTNPLSSPAKLTITPSGPNVILTWSTNAVGFTLQSTTNVPSAASWVSNSPGPVIIAGQNTLTNPLAGPRQFFRLIH